MPLSESTKRNLCLLPGALVLAGLVLAESCRSNRTDAPSDGKPTPTEHSSTTNVVTEIPTAPLE